MSLHGRLERLEKIVRGGGTLTEAGLTLGGHREVLHRLTDEELERYHDALEREGAWAEENLPILRRVEEVWEEVERERAIE